MRRPAGWVVGLDLSLTSTGVCAIPMGWDPGAWYQVRGAVIVSEPREDRIERIAQIVRELEDELFPLRSPVHVFIEGYSFGVRSQQTRAFGLGELGGVVRWVLRKRGALLAGDVPATQWRKFLLGANPGTGAKEIAHRALREAGAPWECGDTLDAFGVANFGLADLGRVGLTLGVGGADAKKEGRDDDRRSRRR